MAIAIATDVETIPVTDNPVTGVANAMPEDTDPVPVVEKRARNFKERRIVFGFTTDSATFYGTHDRRLNYEGMGR